jgi:hypothetical protein
MAIQADPWAKKWLNEQREAGITGLTVDKRADGHHYVIRSTTVWDKETKKRKKAHMEYLGRLQPDGTLYKRPQRKRAKVRTVRCSGVPRVLEDATDFLPQLKETFPHQYRELTALAWTRVWKTGTLKVAGEEWDAMEDVLDLRPSAGPGALSDALREAGADPASQIRFFSSLAESAGRHMAVDLSVVFSRSKGAMLVKKGFNRFRLNYTQFKVVLVCDQRSGLPISMRPVPGNMKDSMSDTLREMDLGGCVLVLDRGFFASGVIEDIAGAGADFVIAAKRDSKAYASVPLGNVSFHWSGRSIRYGCGKLDGKYWYRFEDLSLKESEQVDELVRAGTELSFGDGRHGNIMICSSLNVSPESIYRMYKNRESVEQNFDSAKNVLNMDRTYMSDDDGIRGHMFVTFLAMRIRSNISRRLEENGLLGKFTPEDVLRKYSSAYAVRSPDVDLEYEVGADLRKFDKMLGLNLYQ